jgi:hypothetical protein
MEPGVVQTLLQPFRLFTLFLFLTGLLASAQNVTYTIGSNSAARGSTTTLTISITGNEPAGLQWTLDYNATDISGITVTPGSAATAAGKSVSCSSASGSITCLVAGKTTGIANGVVAQAVVQVAAGTSDATTSLELTKTVSSLADGSSVASTGSSGVVTIQEAPPALRFIAMTPCRVVDTRTANGTLGSPSLVADGTRSFTIPSSTKCSIPSTAAAYALNVTVVPKAASLSYITVWPTGQTQPLVSTLNSLDGTIRSNAAILPAGTSGALSVYATNATDLVLDIDGYFVPSTNTSALAFYPLTPCRIADTRSSSYPALLGPPALSSGQTRSFPILSSTCDVPTTAQAYSLNLTAVPSGPLSYLTAFPTGQSMPVTSSLNDPTGAIRANAAIVRAGTGGAVDVYATDDTELVIDINGYFAPAATGGLSLYNLTPCRVLDTRKNGGQPFSGQLDVNVAASGCGALSTAQAYVFNATVVPPGPLGYLTLWQEGKSEPVASTLNASDGQITNNMAIVSTSNGSIAAAPSNPTQLVLDLFGNFAP